LYFRIKNVSKSKVKQNNNKVKDWKRETPLAETLFLPSNGARKSLLGTQLGTPRGRYDEHSIKSSLGIKLRFIEPVGERTQLPKVDARWLGDSSR
jgi:hypothetical protein